MSPVMTALELLPMRVRNIFICSMVVFWASSRMMKASLRVRPRMKASGATSITLRSIMLIDLLDIEHVEERVVKRAQVGIDLFLQGAGKEAEALAGLDRGTDQNDAADALGVDGGHGHGDGEIGFAGAGRAHAEDHVVLLDGLDVAALVERAGLDGALDAGGALLAGFGHGAKGGRGIGHDQAQHAVQFAVVGMDALAAQGLEVLKDAPDAGDAFVGALHMHGVGAKIDADAERVFHQPEVFIAGPEQGLKVGRDLQSDLQRVQRPPGRRVPVNVSPPQRNKALAGGIVEMLSAVIVSGARSIEIKQRRRTLAARRA